MKYSKRSVFFSENTCRCPSSPCSAHLSVATVEQDIGPPSVRPKTRAARRLVHRMKSIGHQRSRVSLMGQVDLGRSRVTSMQGDNRTAHLRLRLCLDSFFTFPLSVPHS